MAGSPPPSHWIKEAKLSSGWNQLLPPQPTLHLITMTVVHLAHIQVELQHCMEAKAGSLRLPESEIALIPPVARALVARSYAAWWTKSKLTASRIFAFNPVVPHPPDYTTTPAAGLLIPKCHNILVSGTGMHFQYALNQKIVPMLHLNNSPVPNPAHMRTGIEVEIIKLCGLLGIPLTPYMKDQTLEATNFSLATAIDDHRPIAAPQAQAFLFRTVYGFDNEMSVDDIVVSAVWNTLLRPVLNANQLQMISLTPAPVPAAANPPILGDNRADVIIAIQSERQPKRRRLAVAEWPLLVRMNFMTDSATADPPPEPPAPVV